MLGCHFHSAPQYLLVSAYAYSRDYWARNVSPNKYVKVYLGAPGAAGGANKGYVPISTLKSIAVRVRQSYPSFGAVMLWDASQAYGEKYCSSCPMVELIEAPCVVFNWL